MAWFKKGDMEVGVVYEPHLGKIITMVSDRGRVVWEKELSDEEILRMYEQIEHYLEDHVKDSTGLLKLLIKAVKELIRLKTRGEI